MTSPEVFRRDAVDLVDRTLFTKGPQRLSVLVNHQVLRESDFMRPITSTAAWFRAHMRTLVDTCRHFSLETSLQHLKDGTLIPRVFAVTFNDGERDNFEVALPMLKQLDISSAVFVSSYYLDGA